MKLLLYCCKAKPYLYKTEKPMIEKKFRDYHTQLNKAVLNDNCLNGKIVAECDFEVEDIGLHKLSNGVGYDYIYETETKPLIALELMSCLDLQDLENYLGTEKDNGETCGYAIHITNLKIFDEPRELSDCHKKYGGINYSPIYYMPITNAPQNMMRVWVYENGKWVMYILISIQSQWMCLILNRIKDVEVRRVVLKEMMG